MTWTMAAFAGQVVLQPPATSVSRTKQSAASGALGARRRSIALRIVARSFSKPHCSSTSTNARTF
jgi:hypothetical protein